MQEPSLKVLKGFVIFIAIAAFISTYCAGFSHGRGKMEDEFTLETGIPYEVLAQRYAQDLTRPLDNWMVARVMDEESKPIFFHVSRPYPCQFIKTKEGEIKTLLYCRDDSFSGPAPRSDGGPELEKPPPR